MFPICNRGFDERLARENSYYGAGIYLSSDPRVADEWTVKNKNISNPHLNRNIILSWVQMGRPFRPGMGVSAFPNEPRYRCKGHAPPEHDSIIADWLTKEQTEEQTYVVFRGDQVVPYFVITYNLKPELSADPFRPDP